MNAFSIRSFARFDLSSHSYFQLHGTLHTQRCPGKIIMSQDPAKTNVENENKEAKI
jgi:hypothetical protein